MTPLQIAEEIDARAKDIVRARGQVFMHGERELIDSRHLMEALKIATVDVCHREGIPPEDAAEMLRRLVGVLNNAQEYKPS